ncbi:MAG: hypothetical protein LAO03_18795 [Acidobacteriia bacterium]|nr:hypothetical protein [Terriglobia bacterium]
MKDLYEVLRSKEMDIARVRGEIQALRGIIPLLEEETTSSPGSPERPSPSSSQRNRWPLDLSPADQRSSGP